MLLSVLLKRGWSKVKMWREISRQRSELRRLSETLAKDIGISRADAEHEADRPFWDYKPEKRSLRHDSSSHEEQHNCCLQS